MYLDGQFVEASNKQTRDIYNPAKGEVMARVPEATPADVEKAIAAARREFDEGKWPNLAPAKRGHILFKIAEAIRAQAQELARLETMNMGKPLSEAEGDVTDAADSFEYYGGLANKITGEVNPVNPRAFDFTLKEPIGVCGQIIPWNFPLMMAAWKIAPAIAAGCTVVLKPAEQTPLTALKLAEILDGIEDLPKGVVNIVTGDGPTTGATLVKSHDVDKIAFTGSTEVGKWILKTAAETNLKKVTLELGGKSPNIFFADSDFEMAIAGALFGIFYNQGEVCSAGSRILVEKSIHKKLVEAMAERAQQIRLGDGLDPSTKMGPLVTAGHCERVESYIQIGKQSGKLICGGQRPSALTQGYFLEPTIFDQVDPSSRLAQEEVFGPVVAVIPFENESEAIKLANHSDYGLAAAVWTKDFTKAMRMIRKIHSGIVWVNHYHPAPMEGPWGGFKQSGIGRELGKYGIENYLQAKQVYVNLQNKPVGW
ncbi:aldehyde dehydrogenase [candidate division KSB1 bacterium]|nr:MAG: aldehyde dehydrogenase [candidate division KSB1 bacterium]